MKQEHFDQIERLIESMNSSIADLWETIPNLVSSRLTQKQTNAVKVLRSELNNIDKVADRIYQVCEESHGVSGGSNLAGYEDLDVLLPNANRLSASDYEALVDHLQEWRKEIGLPAAHL